MRTRAAERIQLSFSERPFVRISDWARRKPPMWRYTGRRDRNRLTQVEETIFGRFMEERTKLSKAQRRRIERRIRKGATRAARQPRLLSGCWLARRCSIS